MEKNRNTYTRFRTDVPNILGGWNTYWDLSTALKFCRHKVFVQTRVKRENNLGIDTGNCLSKLLWETEIYSR